MRLLTCIALALGASTAAQAQTSIVPLETQNMKQYAVVAEVGGTPRRFLFDTGEGTTMITAEVAQDIGCVPWGNTVAFRMLGERLDLPRCDDVRFRMAELATRAFSTIVYDLTKLDPDNGGVAGAIGLDLFDGKRVTLQFGARRLIVDDSGAALPKGAIEVPIRLARFSEGGIDVNIGVKTPKGIAWMELDSANAGPTIFVAPAIAPLMGLRTDIKTAQPVRAEIVPGVTFEGQARVFPGMILDGNIGMQFMKLWDVTLDLKTGRGWVTPAARP